MKLLQMLRAVLATAWKDIQVIFKDRGGLVVIILLPAVFSILFGSLNQALSDTEESKIKFSVVVFNQDSGSYGDQIMSVLGDIDVLSLKEVGSEEEAVQRVIDSEAIAAILIPDILSQNLTDHQPGEIDVILDPTQEQFAEWIPGIMSEVIAPFVIQAELSYGIHSVLSEAPGYADLDEGTRQGFEAQNLAVQMAQVQQMLMDPWVTVRITDQESEDLVIVPTNLFALLVPSFTVMFAFFIVGAMASELLKERQQGSLRRLIAAPIKPWNIIAGKMLAYMVLVFVQVSLIFGGAAVLFNMPLGDSLLGLFLVTLGMGFAATGLGMMIAAISKSDRQADSLGLLVSFVLAGIGGCFIVGSPVPLYKGGGIMETLSKLTPHAHALLGYDALLNGAGLAEALPQVAILFGFGLVFLVIASLRFRYET